MDVLLQPRDEHEKTQAVLALCTEMNEHLTGLRQLIQALEIVGVNPRIVEMVLLRQSLKDVDKAVTSIAEFEIGNIDLFRQR